MKHNHTSTDFSFVFLCLVVIAGIVAACLPSAPATNSAAPAALVQHVNAESSHNAVNPAVRGES